VQIAIVGLGYVGAVTTACLAQMGRSVIGVDQDAVKADAIAGGQSPISEPGLDEALAAGVAAGRIRVAPIDIGRGDAEALQQRLVQAIGVGVAMLDAEDAVTRLHEGQDGRGDCRHAATEAERILRAFQLRQLLLEDAYRRIEAARISRPHL